MDKFYRGLTAGVISGIPMNIWSLISYHLLEFGDLRFLDWAALMIYGNKSANIIQEIYASLMHFAWVGFLGVIFAYLVPVLGPKWLLGKAIFYSFIIGFITYAIPVLFSTPELTSSPLETVLHNHLGGIIWGISLALVYQYLGKYTYEA